MKYNNFEELYKDNAPLIEFEFKARLSKFLKDVLSQIDWYQEKEHENIDGGNCSMENDDFRRNIINLERIYAPLYNYIYNWPEDMLLRKEFPVVCKMRHDFLDMALPSEDEINHEYRGKPEWRHKLHQLEMKQRRMAELLEGIVIWAYELGCKDYENEPKDLYNDPENGSSHKNKMRYLLSYGRDTTFAKIFVAIYNQAYKEYLEQNPDDYENASKEAASYLEDFIREMADLAGGEDEQKI
jgi:hypothetical protein